MAKKKKSTTKRLRTDRGEGNVMGTVQLYKSDGVLFFTGSDVGEPIMELPDAMFTESTVQEFKEAMQDGSYEVYDLGTASGEHYTLGE